MLFFLYGKKRTRNKRFIVKFEKKSFLIPLLILTFCSNGQTQGFGMSIEVDRSAALLQKPKNQKLKRNEPSPYSGILISEEQFRKYEYAMDENDILNKYIKDQKPIENCDSCFKSNVLSGMTGTAIGVLVTSVFFLLIK